MEGLKLSFNLEALEQSRTSDFDTIKDGTSYYRILPPYGTNHNGFPWAYHALHFGLKDVNDSVVPVRCSYDKEKFCPICEKVWEVQEALEALGKTASDAEKEPYQQYINTFKADRAFYVNAVNQEGLVKKLKLKSSYITGKRGQSGKTDGRLVQLIKEAVNDKNFDPFSIDTGVWFKFTRTGKLFNTDYNVEFKRTSSKINGRIIEELDTTLLSEQFPELYAQLKAQLESGVEGPMFDIHTMYEVRSSTELRRYLDGEPVPSRRGNNENGASAGATLKVGPLKPLAQAQVEEAVARVAEAEKAQLETVAEVEAQEPAKTATVDDVSVDAAKKIAEAREKLKALGITK